MWPGAMACKSMLARPKESIARTVAKISRAVAMVSARVAMRESGIRRIMMGSFRVRGGLLNGAFREQEQELQHNNRDENEDYGASNHRQDQRDDGEQGICS